MGHGTGENDTVYTFGGALNGKGVHNWHCLSCPWKHQEVGGRIEQNRGQYKANRHRCYDSSRDPQKNRKDIHG